jgi:dihydrofolate reductase
MNFSTATPDYDSHRAFVTGSSLASPIHSTPASSGPNTSGSGDLAVKFGKADGYAGKKNYVFSRTLSKPASPKVTVIAEDVRVFAERLRLEKGKHIWLVGGGELVASFLDSGQVDEFIIHVIPKMIGEGIPLVAPRHRDLRLKLLATKRFPDGVVKLHYAVRVK